MGKKESIGFSRCSQGGTSMGSHEDYIYKNLCKLVKDVYPEMRGRDMRPPAEAEFTSYYILVLAMRENYQSSIQEIFHSLDRILRSHPLVGIAVDLAACIEDGNYVRFFRMAREERLPYLLLALLHQYFPTMRIRALDAIISSRAARNEAAEEVEGLRERLGFEDVASCEDFLQSKGMEVKDGRVQFHRAKLSSDLDLCDVQKVRLAALCCGPSTFLPAPPHSVPSPSPPLPYASPPAVTSPPPASPDGCLSRLVSSPRRCLLYLERLLGTRSPLPPTSLPSATTITTSSSWQRLLFLLLLNSSSSGCRRKSSNTLHLQHNRLLSLYKFQRPQVRARGLQSLPRRRWGRRLRRPCSPPSALVRSKLPPCHLVPLLLLPRSLELFWQLTGYDCGQVGPSEEEKRKEEEERRKAELLERQKQEEEARRRAQVKQDEAKLRKIESTMKGILQKVELVRRRDGEGGDGWGPGMDRQELRS
eukprot:749370-Hanusia_phi.AAC.2